MSEDKKKGLFGKIANFVGVDDEYDDEELDEIIRNEDREKEKEMEKEKESFLSQNKPLEERIPSINKPATATTKFTSNFKLEVIEPAGFEDSPRLVDCLKAKKPVIINLESLETPVAKSIFEFLSGATYALNGDVRKVANNIFVFAPENVTIAKPSSTAAKDTNQSYKNPWA